MDKNEVTGPELLESTKRLLLYVNESIINCRPVSPRIYDYARSLAVCMSPLLVKDLYLAMEDPAPDSYDYLSSHRGMEDEAIIRHYEQQQRDREYERQRQQDQEEYDRQAEECAARMLRDGIDPAEVF